MKKISQGKCEVFTTKADAIDKFMQMQGVCREELSNEELIEFYCSKKGKITITNPPTRHVENYNSTILFAEILEEGGKTYITYHTAFSKSNNVSKLISFIISITTAILAIILAVYTDELAYLMLCLLALAFYAFRLFTGLKEEKNSPKDSEILIQELNKRVEAVNLWDK